MNSIINQVILLQLKNQLKKKQMKKLPEKILLISKSGSGKTYSARNLPVETTGFINVEYKTLPFPNNFKYNAMPQNWSEAYNALLEFGQNDKIEQVFFDSFSAYFDSVLATARKTRSGWDVWNFYNDHIGQFLTMVKRYPKDLILTAHYEWIQDESGPKERRAKVKGKEWEGIIEKEFTIVLYGDVKVDMATKKREYSFLLNTDGQSSAKCPPYIFGEDVDRIGNDANEVLKAIRKQ